MLSEFVNTGIDNNLVSKLFNEPNSTAGNCAKTACAAALAANDLHHIHFNVTGRGFDRIHIITNEYYDKLSEEMDYLGEIALEKRQILPNMTLAGKYLEWNVLTDLSYDYDTAVRKINTVLSTYINYLSALRDTSEDDVASKLDDMIRDWNKELHYKMEHRLEEQE